MTHPEPVHTHTHTHEGDPSTHHYKRNKCRHPECTRENTRACRTYQRTFKGRLYKQLHHDPYTGQPRYANGTNKPDHTTKRRDQIT